MSDKAKKKWSKKKKILVICLSIFLFLFVALFCTALGVLHWYCTPVEYQTVSISDNADFKDTKIIAHRGFNALAPENTAPAFEEAGKADFWGAECDVYRTKDGVWIIQHDTNTYRMMDKTKQIEKATYEELMAMTVDNGNHIDSYPNLKICTLDEYLAICKKYNMNAVIELKGTHNTEHYDQIVDSINKSKADVTFISFHSENLVAMRKLTDAPMFYLASKIDDEKIQTAKDITNCGIDYNADKECNFEDGWLKKCQDNGLALGAWTVNDTDVMAKAVENGTTYITTNCITE